VRSRPTVALVGCSVATLLAIGWTVRPASASGAVGSSQKGAGGPQISSTTRARSSTDGISVQVFGSPLPATTAVAVRFRVQAEVQHAHGALSYDLSYGDGTTSSNVTPDICLGGAGSTRKMTWGLRHRYGKPGTYHLAVTVRAVCSPGRVTARMTIDVKSGPNRRTTGIRLGMSPTGTSEPAIAGGPMPAGRIVVDAGTQPRASGSSLCGTVPHLDVLVVHRVVHSPRNRLQFTFPARVEVDRPIQVRAVARALCSLSPQPTGIMSCPADLGIEYTLDFSAPGHHFDRVVADAGGCEGVSGVAAVTLRATTVLWDALGRAIGLTPRPTGYAYGYPFGSRGLVTTFVPPTAP
jgi:hypothetical protein